MYTDVFEMVLSLCFYFQDTSAQFYALLLDKNKPITNKFQIIIEM